jgi:hypothetical protein
MFGTEIAGTSAPVRSGESAAGREPALPSQLIRWMSVDQGTMTRIFRGERSSDRSRCPGSVPVMLSAVAPLLPADTVSVSMGPLPREDLIGEFTDLFRDACLRKDPEVMSESALWFYSNPRNFDPAVIGGLVPSGGNGGPPGPLRGSLVLMGGPPELRGGQVDGTIEVLWPGDDAYEFLLQAWKLFMSRGSDPAGSELGKACLFRIE